MTDKLRMYGLVPYNISPIQQGIQFGHAVVEYGLKNFNSFEYQEWANKDKVFIILNGGTTNNDILSLGSLNKHLETLNDFGVKFAEFYEPDLGDQLTAIVFIVDEKVYNKNKYRQYTYHYKETFIDKIALFFNKDLRHVKYNLWMDSLTEEEKSIVNFRKFLSEFRFA
jgi:uncharacterized membrane protein